MKTTVIILSLLLISCGPNYYLRRAERNLKKAEMLGAQIGSDTIYKYVNVYVPDVKKDTVFTSKPGDTIYISKDRLRIKYVNLPGDSVFIKGECKDSIITVKHPIVINRTIKSVRNKLPWWVYAVFGVCALVITVLCFRR